MNRRTSRNLPTMQGPRKQYQATQQYSIIYRPNIQPVGIDKWEKKTDHRNFENKALKTTKLIGYYKLKDSLDEGT